MSWSIKAAVRRHTRGKQTEDKVGELLSMTLVEANWALLVLRNAAGKASSQRHERSYPVDVASASQRSSRLRHAAPTGEFKFLFSVICGGLHCPYVQ